MSVSWWDLRGSWNVQAIERERKTRGKKPQGEDRQVAEERKLWTKTGPVRRSAINQPLFGENCKRKAPGASVEEARSHKALSLVARASLQPLTGRQFGFCFRGLPEQRGATEERKSRRRYAVERQGNCAANKTQWSCGGAATRCVFQLFLIIFWKPRPRLMHTPTPGSTHSRPASLRPCFSPSPYRSLSLFHVQFKNTSTAPPTHRVFFPFSFVLFSRSLGRRCHRLPDKEENSKKRSFESELCATGARSKVEITAGIWLNRRHKTARSSFLT